MASDEDFARYMLDSGEEPPPYRERFSDWSAEREALARVEDALRYLTGVTMALQGQKPPSWGPVQRPIPAIERLRYQRKKQEHLSLVSKFLPDAAGSPD